MPALYPQSQYWIADDSRIYSGPTQKVVDNTDAGYLAFVASGRVAKTWPRDAAGGQTNAAILALVSPYGMGIGGPLIAYAARARYAKEVGGTTVSGIAMPTDRATQAQFQGAYLMAQHDNTITVQWKMPDGSFTALTGAQILALGIALSAFVQQCFAVEKNAVTGINGGSITTTAQIDALFAAF